MIEIMVDDGVAALASEENIIEAIEICCLKAKNIKKPSLCMRFSSNDVVRQLNGEWRDKDSVTDVLSFPMLDAAELAAAPLAEDEPLGDIILATPFVIEEANRLGISPADHAIHLIIHGCLHLLGYDHIEDDDADVMQALENRSMAKLGLHQPYPDMTEQVQT